MNWHPSFRLCPLFLCFGFVLGVCFVFLVFAFFLLFGGDFVTAYWTVPRSFTSSLLKPLNQQTARIALINHAT